MEDSYKKIREEKANKKVAKQNIKDEIVVEVVDDNKDNLSSSEKKSLTKEPQKIKTTTNINTKGRK